MHTKAIVLNVMDFGESDKIITLYTRHYGKVKGIAKGAKRSKKRFVNKLEYFTLLNVTALPSRRSNLALIDQAELLNPYLSLRENYRRYIGAMLVCELVDQWTRENDSDEHLFRLLCWVLDTLAASPSIADAIIFFQIKLLDIVGLGLQFDHCMQCHTPIQQHTCRFSLAHNGLLCANCKQPSSAAEGLLSLSAATIKTMQKAQSLPLKKIHRLKFSKISRDQTAKLLRLYTQFQLQRDIHCWKQFEKVMAD